MARAERARVDPGRLRLRVLSALALAPVPIAAIWFGWPWLPLLTALAAAVMAWEWGRLCRRGRAAAAGPIEGGRIEGGRIEGGRIEGGRIEGGRIEGGRIEGGRIGNLENGDAESGGVDNRRVRIVLVGVVVAAVAVAALGAAALALGCALLGAGIVFWAAGGRPGPEPRWAALGALWVALPCVSLLWLAGAPTGGRATLLWLLAVVWATDIGAFAVGRAIGGPRLAPRWSPRKTWAGLIGGTLSAGLVGWATARSLGIAPAAPLVLVSAGLAVVGQLGDLAESLAKRRFGVKDSSGLIPGHGGLLDRLDGLLAVVPTAALLTLIGGRSMLGWR